MGTSRSARSGSADRVAARRLYESERLYRDFEELRPHRTLRLRERPRRRGRRGDNRVLIVCRLLNRHRVRYLLAGGVAANLHGSVRATADVDVLVPKDPRNTERLLEALAELPFGVAGELDAARVLRKPVTIVGDDPRVDILTVAWTVTYDRALPSRRVRRIAGVRVPYLGLEDLLRSKRTGRAADQADIDALRALVPGARRRRGSRTK